MTISERDEPTPADTQVDAEGGNEVEVEIGLTPAAWTMAKELLATTEEYQGMPMRLYIEGKGCDGFYYGVNFDKAEADDLLFEVDGLECVVDPRTYLFCKGSTIDWVDDERGRGFSSRIPKRRISGVNSTKKSTWRTRLEAMAAQGSTP